MEIKILEDKITLEELKLYAEDIFGNYVKAVVDIEKELVVIGGELHSDEESILLQDGSKQSDLWGINIYPDKSRSEWIEFDSVINLRPSMKNYSRNVEDDNIKSKIIEIINNFIN